MVMIQLSIGLLLQSRNLLLGRITGLNVNIMTQYECVSCLVIAIIVAFVVVIHVQCFVSVYLSLVKKKEKKKKKRTMVGLATDFINCKRCWFPLP